MKNMAFANVGTVMLAIHTSAAPTDAEWSAYLGAFKKIPDLASVRCIAFTDGGAPTTKHRKDLNELLGGRSGLAAVVSASVLVRSVVTALTWFNPLVKAFAPENVDEAYSYLKLTPVEVDGMRKTIDALRREFGAPLHCIGA